MKCRGVAIRLKLKIRNVENNKSTEIIALVNSGYETLEPEILLPYSIAEKIGLYPELPKNFKIIEYTLADGSKTKLIRMPKILEVCVIAEDRVSKTVLSNVVIAEKLMNHL